MVEQVIRYSDGTETVIKYRGVVVDGELVSEKVVEGAEESAPAVEEAVKESPDAPLEAPASDVVADINS